MDSSRQNFFEANRQLWNARVPIHRQSDFYEVDAFLQGKNVLDAIVLDGLGDVRGKSLLHLQCHFGQDTLCLARMGAQVTGIDFSGAAIEEAGALARKLNIDATFVESNVYDLRDKLSGKFDIVFTSYGVLGWLPDLEEWAAVVHHFLKPGGTFFIAEFHPILYLFDFDKQSVAYDYFNRNEPWAEKVEGTYADVGAAISGEEFFWQHSLDEAIRPLLKKGLQMLDFAEYPYSPYACFPNLKEVEPGKFKYGDFGVSLPHVFSLKMIKP